MVASNAKKCGNATKALAEFIALSPCLLPIVLNAACCGVAIWLDGTITLKRANEKGTCSRVGGGGKGGRGKYHINLHSSLPNMNRQCRMSRILQLPKNLRLLKLLCSRHSKEHFIRELNFFYTGDTGAGSGEKSITANMSMPIFEEDSHLEKSFRALKFSHFDALGVFEYVFELLDALILILDEPDNQLDQKTPAESSRQHYVTV
eukprot:scaffold7775_cov61-Cyclotella_meneghiniana.AAC.4